MTRLELIASTAAMSGRTQEDCALVLDHLLGVLTGRLAMGRTIRMRGHMTIFTVLRAPRPAFKVNTMEPVMVPARTGICIRFPKGYLNARA